PSRGLEIRLDGAPLLKGALNASTTATTEDALTPRTPIPVDPGAHVIQASAPGKTPWSRAMNVDDGAGEIVVDVPALDEAHEVSAAKDANEVSAANDARRVAPDPPPREPARGRRVAGYVGLGLGAAMLGVSAAFGVRAVMLKD